MKILIIGATRGVGRHLAEQASSAGHDVTLLVRLSSTGFPVNDSRFRIVHGDVRDPVAVSAAVNGQEAVCLCIGIKRTRKPVNIFSQAGWTVVEAMEQEGVKRLVCVTGIGAGDSLGHGGFLYDKIVEPLVLRTIYEDKTRQEEIVRRSALDWTLARPGFLTNEPAVHRYRAISDLKGVTARKISRADVAEYLLRELETGADIGKAVLVDGYKAIF